MPRRRKILLSLPGPLRIPYRSLKNLLLQARVSMRKLSPVRRALPSWLIVGAARAGTTSLYDAIVQHPRIRPALTKEVSFFSHHFTRGERWYRAHFPSEASLAGGLIAGEASPAYIFHPLAPARIASLLPNVRLIALLRDPVRCAVSLHSFVRSLRFETLPLAEALRREEERIGPVLKALGSDENADIRPLVRFSYKSRGIYVDQIKRLHAHFPKERVLILKSEDFFAEPSAVLRQVFDFIGVDPDFRPPDLSPQNTGLYESGGAPPEVMAELKAFFAPHNARLYEYLGRDFGW